MRSLHDKAFFRAWDSLYSATNPDREKDAWEFDGASWTKERHAYWGNNYSAQLEVHQLEMRGKWKLLVKYERWWGADKSDCIRDQFWVKLLYGRAEVVRAWLTQNSITE